MTPVRTTVGRSSSFLLSGLWAAGEQTLYFGLQGGQARFAAECQRGFGWRAAVEAGVERQHRADAVGGAAVHEYRASAPRGVQLFREPPHVLLCQVLRAAYRDAG